MDPEPNSQPPSSSSMPSSTHTKTRRKMRQVSSRYLTSLSSIPQPPTPFSTSNSIDPSSFSPTHLGKDQFGDENLDIEKQSRPMRPVVTSMLSRNPFKPMVNFEVAEDPIHHCSESGAGSASNSMSMRCLREWGLDRKEIEGSLCPKSLKSGSSSEQDKGIGGLFGSLKPPKAPIVKGEMKVSRESKVLKRQEDAHLLRLLDNRYLQWRFVNAKSQVADWVRSVAAEKSLHNVLCKVVELRDSVSAERIAVERLRREKILAMIVEAQVSHLDEWASLEVDYSRSLSETIKALLDASSGLPITEHVKADTYVLKEVLNSAVIMMESSSSYVEKFLSTADGMESILLELTRTVSREKALIKECGDLLSVVHDMQVKDCSLRSQLIQVKQSLTVEASKTGCCCKF